MSELPGECEEMSSGAEQLMQPWKALCQVNGFWWVFGTLLRHAWARRQPGSAHPHASGTTEEEEQLKPGAGRGEAWYKSAVASKDLASLHCHAWGWHLAGL